MSEPTETNAVETSEGTETHAVETAGGVEVSVGIEDAYLVELVLRPAEDDDREAVEKNERTYTLTTSFDEDGGTIKIPKSQILPPNVTHILALPGGIDVMYRQEMVFGETFMRITMLFTVRTDPPVDYRQREDWATLLAHSAYDKAYPFMVSHASMAYKLIGQVTGIPRMPEDSLVTFESLDDHGGVYPGDGPPTAAEPEAGEVPAE